MNIYTVRDNLKNTIAGKENLLAEYKKIQAADIVSYAVMRFLEVNLEELRTLLVDVEKCCEQHNEMGWQLNPERMGQ